jgi:hypothetical protein
MGWRGKLVRREAQCTQFQTSWSSWPLKMGLIQSRNVGKELPLDTALYPRRVQFQSSSLCFKNIDNSQDFVTFQQWSELECQKFVTIIHSKGKGIISRVVEHCDDDRQCTRTTNRVDVFGTGITLSSHAHMSQAAAGLCRLQHCAVLGSSGIKLSEYICTWWSQSAH